MRRFLAILIMFASGATAFAQDLPSEQRAQALGGLRALNTADAAAAWSAVGRLDTSASFCSATLIAPDLVLTAAHCLYHPRTGARFDIEDLTFSAGLRNGRAEAVRSVRRTMELPGYSARDGENMEMIGRDLALLELQRPISAAAITPIPTGLTGRGSDPVTVVSYGADREAHASIEEGCDILARRGAVRSLSCRVVSGASGSPVLRFVDGRPEVIAVMSARAEVDGEEISLAVVLDGQLADLLDQRARGTGFGNAAATVTMGGSTSFIGLGDTGRDSIGARFVRP